MPTRLDSDGTGPRPPEATGKILAALLRSWRERAHLTQEQLAERAGLNVRTIRRWESSDLLRRPQSTSLRQLAGALDLTPRDKALLFTAARNAASLVAPDPTGSQPGFTARDGPPAGAVVPRQLPADVDGFVGRTAELTALNRLLDNHDEPGPQPMVVAAVTGTSGVGKTALAVHWAHRVSHHFPDGQLYVDLRGYHPSADTMETADAIRGFLDALGIPPTRIPTTPDAQAALYRSITADKRILVLLDNARDSEHLRPILPGSATCLVVTTSRDQLTSLIATNTARPLVLDLLRTDEARELLARRLTTRQTTAESRAADQIIASCARLPLALAIAAARAASSPHLPLSTLAAQLRQTRSGLCLDALALGDPYADTRAVFSWSYRGLSNAAARLFRLLGHHHGPDITVTAAASLVGQTTQQIQTLLTELCRAHVLIEHCPSRYTFHNLLRAYAAELAHNHDGNTDIRNAQHRALDHHLHTAHAAVRLINPDREPIRVTQAQPGVVMNELTDHEQAMTWLTDEHNNLLAAIHQANTIGMSTYAQQLAWTLTDFFTCEPTTAKPDNTHNGHRTSTSRTTTITAKRERLDHWGHDQVGRRSASS